MYKYPDLMTCVVAGTTSILGAIARWYENGLFNKPFGFWTFALDMVISAGSGLLVFWLVHDLGQPESVCAMASAITGNLGSRVFDIARIVLKDKLKK